MFHCQTLAPTNASYNSYQVYATNQKVWKKQPSVYLRNLKWMLINVVDKVTTMHQTCRAYTRVFRQGLKEKTILLSRPMYHVQLTHLTLLGVSLTRRRVQKPQLVYICTRAECFFLGIHLQVEHPKKSH